MPLAGVARRFGRSIAWGSTGDRYEKDVSGGSGYTRLKSYPDTADESSVAFCVVGRAGGRQTRGGLVDQMQSQLVDDLDLLIFPDTQTVKVDDLWVETYRNGAAIASADQRKWRIEKVVPAHGHIEAFGATAGGGHT